MTSARLGTLFRTVALACVLHLSWVTGATAAPACGDADASGAVTVTDGVQTLRAAAGLASPCSVEVCDVDDDGTITVTDGVNVLRAAAGLPNPCAASATPTPAPTSSPAAILNNGEWVIAPADAAIPEAPFAVSIDGVAAGTARTLVFSNRVPGTSRFPQVLVVYASGFLRLKAGADPTPPLPFGQSLVLGPAIFGTSASCPETTLFFNPQLTSVAVDTTGLAADGTGTLRLGAVASALGPGGSCTKTNEIMSLAWEILLEEPTNPGARITMAGSFEFTEEVRPDAGRSADQESFRLVQISSMFIDGARHDVDAFRFRSPTGTMTIPYEDRKSTRLNSSHLKLSRMPSSA